MIRNFLFHRVNPKRDLLWDPVDPAHFDACIKYISNHYEVVLFEELALSSDLHSGKKFATIMFDDGYLDNLDYAAPILEKYNCKASFYVVTDCIDHNIPTWTHNLEYAFSNTKMTDIDMRFDFLPESLHASQFMTQVERLAYVKKLKPALKKVSHEQRLLVLSRVFHAFEDVRFEKLMMNWEQVSQLKSAGHYIGSHTVTHCMLGTMSKEDEVLFELNESARKIEEKLGHRPITISYPVGSFNADTKRLSKQAGYQIGLAVKQNVYNPAKDEIYEVPRIELYNESWFKTKLRISNTLENIKSLIGYR